MAYFQIKRTNKYGNKSAIYNGISYHSNKEADYAAELDMRIRGKDIKSWKRQIPIRLCAYGKPICTYYIDFIIKHNDNSEEYVEVKGFKTEVWRLKWKMTEALFGTKKMANKKLTLIT